MTLTLTLTLTLILNLILALTLTSTLALALSLTLTLSLPLPLSLTPTFTLPTQSGSRRVLTNNRGMTLLMQSARDGNLDNVRRLIGALEREDERQIILNHCNNDDLTALHFALMNGHVSVVKLLLESKADPLGNGAVMTPLERVDVEISCLERRCQELTNDICDDQTLDQSLTDKFDLLSLMREARDCLVSMPGFNQRVIQTIFERSQWYRLPELWKLLALVHTFDVNQLITKLDTLLTFAVDQPLTYLEKLLSLRPPNSPHGVDVNCNCALHRFVEAPQRQRAIQLVRVLLEYGASAVMLDDEDTSALTIAYELLDRPSDMQVDRDAANEIFKAMFQSCEQKQMWPTGRDWENLRRQIEGERPRDQDGAV